VRLTFEQRLRGEQKFASIDDLVAQIRRDADAARTLLR
jgi:FAD synthase